MSNTCPWTDSEMCKVWLCCHYISFWVEGEHWTGFSMVYMVQQLVLAWLQSAMAFLVGGVCLLCCETGWWSICHWLEWRAVLLKSHPHSTPCRCTAAVRNRLSWHWLHVHVFVLHLLSLPWCIDAAMSVIVEMHITHAQFSDNQLTVLHSYSRCFALL